MSLSDQELQELCNDAHDDAAEEIRELRAQLAAAEARAKRIKSISASAIKTSSRDVADWADDMHQIAALAEGEAG